MKQSKEISFWKPVKIKSVKTGIKMKPLFDFSMVKSPKNFIFNNMKNSSKPLGNIKSIEVIKPNKEVKSFGIPNPKPVHAINMNNNIPKKEMNWFQAKSKYPKLSPFGDADKDRVINMLDCKPFNKYLQERNLFKNWRRIQEEQKEKERIIEEYNKRENKEFSPEESAKIMETFRKEAEPYMEKEILKKIRKEVITKLKSEASIEGVKFIDKSKLERQFNGTKQEQIQRQFNGTKQEQEQIQIQRPLKEKEKIRVKIIKNELEEIKDNLQILDNRTRKIIRGFGVIKDNYKRNLERGPVQKKGAVFKETEVERTERIKHEIEKEKEKTQRKKIQLEEERLKTERARENRIKAERREEEATKRSTKKSEATTARSIASAITGGRRRLGYIRETDIPSADILIRERKITEGIKDVNMDFKSTIKPEVVIKPETFNRVKIATAIERPRKISRLDILQAKEKIREEKVSNKIVPIQFYYPAKSSIKRFTEKITGKITGKEPAVLMGEKIAKGISKRTSGIYDFPITKTEEYLTKEERITGEKIEKIKNLQKMSSEEGEQIVKPFAERLVREIEKEAIERKEGKKERIEKIKKEKEKIIGKYKEKKEKDAAKEEMKFQERLTQTKKEELEKYKVEHKKTKAEEKMAREAERLIKETEKETKEKEREEERITAIREKERWKEEKEKEREEKQAMMKERTEELRERKERREEIDKIAKEVKEEKRAEKEEKKVEKEKKKETSSLVSEALESLESMPEEVKESMKGEE